MTICRFFTAAVLALVVACSPTENTDPTPVTPASPYSETVQEAVEEAIPTPPNPYVAALEEAHQRQAFISKEAVRFDILLKFGGKERLNGTITALTNSTKARVDYKNGQSLIYDGDKVYAVDAENSSSKRFAAYTWPYFFLFPYKLSDEGTKWTAYEAQHKLEKPYLTQKLSFEAGTGDDPNDWYITYANPDNQLLEVAAYIVTAGKTQAEAEEDPHAVSYGDYRAVEGIPIAHEWKFWGWRTDQGLTEQLGEATLSNVKFVQASAELFEKPEGYLQL